MERRFILFLTIISFWTIEINLAGILHKNFRGIISAQDAFVSFCLKKTFASQCRVASIFGTHKTYGLWVKWWDSSEAKKFPKKHPSKVCLKQLRLPETPISILHPNHQRISQNHKGSPLLWDVFFCSSHLEKAGEKIQSSRFDVTLFRLEILDQAITTAPFYKGACAPVACPTNSAGNVPWFGENHRDRTPDWDP